MKGFALALLCVSAATTVARPAAGKRPNILLIVSEDNGPELGSYGDPYAQTPVLDELAESGVRFERAYVPQAGCSPSRAAFLTGLYPHQNGQIGLATWNYRIYRHDTPNAAKSLKKVGYRTGIIGKLHVNPEEDFPFDFIRIHHAGFQREELGAYAARAGEFFEQSDRPFFLSINYPDAHRPFLRQADGLPKHPLVAEEVEPLPYMGLDSPVLRRDTADYYNSISRLDSLIGDLLQELRRAGKFDDTLIVYIGDHGADLLRGKRTCYEGGLRIPMIARWPGRKAKGEVRTELVSTLDLLPTFLEAAGAEPIRGLPGRSLEPLLSGESVAWRELLFTEYHVHSNHNYYPQRAVRNQRYKLIWNLMPGEVNPGYDFTIDKFIGAEEMKTALSGASEAIRKAYEMMRRPPELELYDLAEDPFEFQNLADDPQHVGTLGELKDALLAWRRETDDPFLDPVKVKRLQAEIEATRKNGEYQRPESWRYPEYLAPAKPPWSDGSESGASL